MARSSASNAKFRISFSVFSVSVSAFSVLFPFPAQAQGWIEIERRFRNSGNRLAEGSYLYPMPGEAAFTSFSLWMGDQCRTAMESLMPKLRYPALVNLRTKRRRSAFRRCIRPSCPISFMARSWCCSDDTGARGAAYTIRTGERGGHPERVVLRGHLGGSGSSNWRPHASDPAGRRLTEPGSPGP